jgi:hypothetical protein
MLIVPGLPPVQETSHSRELRRRVEQVVRDYQRENSGATEADVHAALALLAQDAAPGLRRRRAFAIATGALLAAGFVAMAATGGTAFQNNTLVWRVVGGAAALVAVSIALISLVRRSD